MIIAHLTQTTITYKLNNRMDDLEHYTTAHQIEIILWLILFFSNLSTVVYYIWILKHRLKKNHELLTYNIIMKWPNLLISITFIYHLYIYMVYWYTLYLIFSIVGRTVKTRRKIDYSCWTTRPKSAFITSR